MTAIDTKAGAVVTKTGPWWKPAYKMELHVGGIFTGLTWDLNRQQAKTFPALVVRHAAELLQHYGLMETAYAAVAGQQKAPAEVPVKELVTPDGKAMEAVAPFSRTNMPRTGQKVALTVTMGKLEKGLHGTVTRVDGWVEGYADHTQFPVRVALSRGSDTVEIPMHLHEIEEVR